MDLAWLKTIAPTVATALGGPLAGLAVDAVGSAFGWSDATKEKVEATLTSGTLNGEQIAKLREAELALAAQEKQLQLDFAKLEVDDRNGARDREIKTGDTATPRWIAFVMITGFFAVLIGLMVFGKPKEGGDAR